LEGPEAREGAQGSLSWRGSQPRAEVGPKELYGPFHPNHFIVV